MAAKKAPATTAPAKKAPPTTAPANKPAAQTPGTLANPSAPASAPVAACPAATPCASCFITKVTLTCLPPEQEKKEPKPHPRDGQTFVFEDSASPPRNKWPKLAWKGSSGSVTDLPPFQVLEHHHLHVEVEVGATHSAGQHPLILLTPAEAPPGWGPKPKARTTADFEARCLDAEMRNIAEISPFLLLGVALAGDPTRYTLDVRSCENSLSIPISVYTQDKYTLSVRLPGLASGDGIKQGVPGKKAHAGKAKESSFRYGLPGNRTSHASKTEALPAYEREATEAARAAAEARSEADSIARTYAEQEAAGRDASGMREMASAARRRAEKAEQRAEKSRKKTEDLRKEVEKAEAKAEEEARAQEQKEAKEREKRKKKAEESAAAQEHGLLYRSEKYRSFVERHPIAQPDPVTGKVPGVEGVTFSLTRNDVAVVGSERISEAFKSFYDVAKTVVGIFRDIEGLKNEIPHEGWYFQWEFVLLQGGFDLAWSFHETERERVVRRFEGDIELILFDLSFELDFGVDFVVGEGALFGRVGASCKFEWKVFGAEEDPKKKGDEPPRWAPKAKVEVFGELGAKGNVGPSWFLSGKASAKATIEGEATFCTEDHLMEAEFTFKGIEVKAEARFLFFKKKASKTFAEAKKPFLEINW